MPSAFASGVLGGVAVTMMENALRGKKNLTEGITAKSLVLDGVMGVAMGPAGKLAGGLVKGLAARGAARLGMNSLARIGAGKVGQVAAKGVGQFASGALGGAAYQMGDNALSGKKLTDGITAQSMLQNGVMGVAIGAGGALGGKLATKVRMPTAGRPSNGGGLRRLVASGQARLAGAGQSVKAGLGKLGVLGQGAKTKLGRVVSNSAATLKGTAKWARDYLTAGGRFTQARVKHALSPAREVAGIPGAFRGDVPQWESFKPKAGLRDHILEMSAENPIWSRTSNKTPVKNAIGHWNKHKIEFPDFINSKKYVEKTKSFLDNSPEGSHVATRPDGYVIVYDQVSETFAIENADGTPKTMSKPDPAKHGYATNLEYFETQK